MYCHEAFYIRFGDFLNATFWIQFCKNERNDEYICLTPVWLYRYANIGKEKALQRNP